LDHDALNLSCALAVLSKLAMAGEHRRSQLEATISELDRLLGKSGCAQLGMVLALLRHASWT
jgi:hypothetical protein